MTQTSFSGPVVVGDEDITLAVNSRVGSVSLVQRISVSAVAALYGPIYLPACNISRIWANVETVYGSGAIGAVFRIGTSADVTRYGTFSTVSAIRTYEAVLSGLTVLGVANNSQLFIDVTAAAGGVAAGQASVYVQYIQTA
ncbi:MAG: hypothetical protein ACREXR_00360 [Gammaproteobacteria bacterium]